MLNLYVETAAPLAPSTSDSVITLSLPSTNGLPMLSRSTSPYAKNSTTHTHARDESTYARQFLASQGAVYFRAARTYPRTFIWRVLNDHRSLELRCADLVRSKHETDEAHLTIRFEVQDPILPAGVALSDADGEDVLYVFIITTKKELRTLAVPLDLFRNARSPKDDRRRWCQTFVPSSFTIDTPHQLYAHTPFELFVSFDSGRLQRLTRKGDEDGSYWVQDNFDDKSWGSSLRGMVIWHSNQSISYDSRRLSQSTTNGMIASSDSTHLYTICLNHTLRVWSLTTGKLLVSKDLLDRAIRPQDRQIILSPATPSFLRLFKVGLMNRLILVTFSPHNEGQFKFWDVQGGLTEPLTVEDKFPDVSLRPPDPDPSGNTIWSLAGFEMRPSSIDESSEIWVLWRNNNFFQVYSLHFGLQDISEAWEKNWVKMQSSISSKAAAPDFVWDDGLDTVEKWMRFLFSPTRYPTSVLETSLSIYQDALRIKPALSKPKTPLQERVCASIASNVNLRKYNDSDLDYARFASDTDTQWRNFWQIAETINQRRKSPISLAYDTYAGMAWVVQSDQCSAIRECNEVELVRYNSGQTVQLLASITSVRWPHRKEMTEKNQTLEQMAQLLDVANAFSRSFSAELTRDCRTALGEELVEEADYPSPYRVHDLYERCNLGDSISNEMYERVVQGVEIAGGLKNLGTAVIPAILDLLPASVRGSHTTLRSTIFGSIVVDAGLTDTITLGWQIVYDLLVFVVFVESEINQEESQCDEFDAPGLFAMMLDIFKEYEKRMWLQSHVRDAQIDFSEPSEDSSEEHQAMSPSQASQKAVRQVTLLRDTKGKDIRPQPTVGSPQSHLLSEMLNDIEAWIGGAADISAADGCVWIQCNLLAHGNIDLATEFSRFQPTTPWSTYVKGRLCIARHEYEQAALYFQQAAHPMAHGKAIGMLGDMSAGLLSVEETDHFNHGIRRYLQHILALFESAEAYSFAADFARLALVAPATDHSERAGNWQDEILCQLFAAELRGARYTPAYAVLTQLSNKQLQERSATAWIDALLGPNSLPKLEAGDTIQLLQRLPLDLHPHLARVVDDHIHTLAQKQASVPALSGRIRSGEQGVDYLKILYACRVRRQDHRGAVAVLVERLSLVKRSSQARNDPRATVLRQTLLALINVLSCVAPDEAYILTPARDHPEVTADAHRDAEGRNMETGWKKRRRIVVTLEDVRREYQQLLDQCSRIERGDFDFDASTEDEGEDSALEGATDANGGDGMEF